jgi:putative FmdB family regulatory protein
MEERGRMPQYVFRCLECGRNSRHFFTYTEYDQAEPTCPHCRSQQMRRVIGRVALARGGSANLDAMSDDDLMAGLDTEDPRALGRFMRQMSEEMGEDMGEEFDEVVGRLEKGESPEAIEASMPELADDAGAGVPDLGGDLDF